MPWNIDPNAIAAVAAIIAIVLSQLPPVKYWFRPNRLDVEVHTRIGINHKVGNPNINLFTGIRNTGGRTVRVKGMSLHASRDGNKLATWRAQNYLETFASENRILFLPFSLKPDESWDHLTFFFTEFDRVTEKSYRAAESFLVTDIREKLKEKMPEDKTAAIAEPELVEPFREMFNRMFVWIPGEYVIELEVDALPRSARFQQRYRFTLFESDEAELRNVVNFYPFGEGIKLESDRTVGVFVPLHRDATV